MSDAGHTAGLVERLRKWADWVETDYDLVESHLLTEAADTIEGLTEALSDLLHAVCHETGFAAAVRADSGLAYPWESLDIAEAQARAAIAKAKGGSDV